MYLGLDPGRDKIGFAFVDENGELLYSGIIPKKLFESFLIALSEGNWVELAPYGCEGDTSLLVDKNVELVLLGGGTTSEELERGLRRRKIEYKVVDESFSTLQARKMYYRIHPPKGFRRLWPLSLLVPGRDIDDLAAWALTRRWMEKKIVDGGVTHGS
jgi:RNase H-fold protein (predicted Holliday junction resolvase)